MEPQSENQPKVTTIGPDRVTAGESEVVVEARHEMPDWQVREFKPTPIYFEDRKYLLIAKNRATKPYAWRYVLRPWPAGETDAGKAFFVYDAESVAERDAAHRGGVRSDMASKALMPFYPFLGLLWKGTQRRLEPLGFVAHSITGVSVFTCFCLAFVQTFCAGVLVNSALRTGKLAFGGMIRLFSDSDHLSLGPVKVPIIWLDALILLALVADVLIRYTRYLRDDQWCGGFLEWVFKRESHADKDCS